jgi:hypothetical protein
MTRSRIYYQSQKLQTYTRVRATLGDTHPEFIINNTNFSHYCGVTPVLASLLFVYFLREMGSKPTKRHDRALR